MLLRPITTACAPAMGTPERSSSSTQPFGVQGTNSGSRPFMLRRPMLSGWNPSTSLSRPIAPRISASSRCFGSGSCTRMPSTRGSALNPRTTASTSACVASAGMSLRVAARGFQRAGWRGAGGRCGGCGRWCGWMRLARALVKGDDADLGAGFALHPHVRLGVLARAHDHHRQAGRLQPRPDYVREGPTKPRVGAATPTWRGDGGTEERLRRTRPCFSFMAATCNKFCRQ